MLDDNLPTFFLKPSAEDQTHQLDLHLSYHGSSPAPAYTLRYIKSSERTTLVKRNAYAVGLFDAYNPEVLFGEVLVNPDWTSPTLNQDEIKRNGGLPPPPQPLVPSAFSIQLYNPEQQIRVEMKEGRWGASDSYEFALPMSTFRTPSASHLDRGQSDPASLSSTPKVFFTWKKESKLNKDLTCYLTGKSTDPPDWKKKKRSRNDPDITIALWRSLRELTIYEPNLTRVEIEDPKGLELVLLLSAIVIKDLCFSSRDDLRNVFNVTPLPLESRISSDGVGVSDSKRSNVKYGLSEASASNSDSHLRAPTLGGSQVSRSRESNSSALHISADPRTQWRIDAETAQLRAQVAAEEQAARLAQQRRLKVKEKEDEAERKRLIKIVQEEERADRRKKADIAKETERLRQLYGTQTAPSFDHRGAFPAVPTSQELPLMSGGNSGARTTFESRPPHKKRSMFGLKTIGNETAGPRNLVRKNSTGW